MGERKRRLLEVVGGLRESETSVSSLRSDPADGHMDATKRHHSYRSARV